MSSKPISKCLWLYIPVLFLCAQVVCEVVLPRSTLEIMHSENGTHEFLQAVVSACAFFVAVSLLPKIDWGRQKLVGGAVLLAAFGSFYITGEEISWGQHIADWSTPQYWASVNDQGETNLHNTSDWLDQKPRLLLYVGIIVGGLVVPLLRRFAPQKLLPAFHALYPSNLVVPTALGVLVPDQIQSLVERFVHGGFFVRVSEVQEIYMYFFVLLYLLDLRNREIIKV